jgi:hypothetical protein
MNVSLIVGSSDSYSDCYEPFFHFLREYWPDCPKPVYLLTENNIWNHEALPVVSSCNGDCAWGKNLRLTMENIKTDYIVLFMVDYFLARPVNHRHFLYFLEVAQSRRLPCLNFIPLATNSGAATPDGLVAMEKHLHYTINCQVALWEKKCLLHYIRDHESPHDFEIWGTRRAWQQDESFYTVDPAWETREGRIFEYTLTGGIRNGKWIKDLVEPMFREHGITIDLTHRGFHQPVENRPLPTVATLFFRILKLPRHIYRRWLSLR